MAALQPRPAGDRPSVGVGTSAKAFPWSEAVGVGWAGGRAQGASRAGGTPPLEAPTAPSAPHLEHLDSPGQRGGLGGPQGEQQGQHRLPVLLSQAARLPGFRG